PSGSGKSSLAFETIYAEGQRRYVETFSPYMRQFLDRMDKPRVDDIRGIPPAIAIEQSSPVKTSRSTVGTMTEINDYLKLLCARVQVIQDRIAIGEENRTRLVEAIETALRFGKGQTNIIPIPETGNRKPERTEDKGQKLSEIPFSTGWHCAYCDLDIRPPTPGLFSFNNPLGACPKCRGFGRTISIDLNKAIPNRRLNIKQGVVRVFR